MCKGADSIVQARLADTQLNQELEPFTIKYLENYANGGLRTLLLAEKEISEAQYEQFKEEYRIAATAEKDRENKVNAVASELEQGFEIIGTTAIEDKLQDDVDKAISAMKKAGIKVWVLTGDKIETAINIGFSCKLLNDKMELFVIDAKNKKSIKEQIAKARMNQIISEGIRSTATVVSGESLFKILAD